jgi:hypothetical protein
MEIKSSCPFCKSTDCEVFIKHYLGNPSTAKVCCKKCGSCGPASEEDNMEKDYEQKAIIMWEERK